MIFKDKVAVVTGASRGIGRATALALAEQGAHVIAIARTIGGLEELDDEIKSKGGSATLVPLDLTDTSKLQALGPNLIARYPSLDVLVSAAGYLDKLMPVALASQDFWPKTIATNVTANITLIQTLYPLLKRAPHSRSVFLTADPDKIGKPFWGFYGASFAALNAVVDSLAAENPEMWIKKFIPKETQTRLREQAYPGRLDGQAAEKTAKELMEFISAN